MSDLVGNPEDRFSQNEAHVISGSCCLFLQPFNSFRFNGACSVILARQASEEVYQCSFFLYQMKIALLNKGEI